MFDNLKAMGAVANLMKNKDKLREAGERMRATLQAARVTGEAGAGAVTAIASGSMKIISISISEPLALGMGADERTRQLAGSLITDAVNDAIGKAQVRAQEEMRREAEALGLGDLAGSDALKGLLGT